MDLTFLSLRDPVSAGSHLAAVAWAALGGLVLVRMSRGRKGRQLAVGIFGASMVFLYAASGLYHALRLPEAQLSYFRRLDHSAIYCLIAGTYTPIFAVLLRGWFRNTLLLIMWGIALVGIMAMWALPASSYPVTVGLYLAMGYIGLIPMVELARTIGLVPLGRGVCGGVIYTAGALCDVFNWPQLVPGVLGPHEVLHLCVIGGTLVHFLFIARYVVPYQGRQEPNFALTGAIHGLPAYVDGHSVVPS